MSALWTFTLDFYGRDGVQPSVIHLQDARGADVNLLIYAAWAAALGLPAFGAARAGDLAAKVAAWRATAIEPLRAVRTALKAGVADVPPEEAEALRRAVLKLEIEAERVEQLVLEAATPEAAGRTPGRADPAVVAANLRGVLGLAEAAHGDRDRQALSAIVRAACPEAGEGEVDAALSTTS